MELVESSGVRLRKSGKSYQGLCPFHEDHHPSLTVNPETGLWHCFGCGKGGDAFSWVMEKEGVPFPQAVEMLAEKAGITNTRIKDKGKRIKATEDRDKGKRIKDKKEKERRWEIYRLAARKYAKKIWEYPAVINYLIQARGLTEETIKKYGIGFCDGKGNTYEGLRGKGFKDNELIGSGLFYKNREEIFRGYITFPNVVGGKVVYLTGRYFEEKEKLDRIDRMDRKKENKKYLKPIGVATNYLFNEGAVHAEEVFLTEGEIDALTLLQNGYAACGVYGVASFKEGWEKKFRGAKKVFIAFDTEENGAGLQGALKIAKEIGSKARIIRLPESENGKMDVNSFFREVGKEGFEALKKTASDSILTEIEGLKEIGDIGERGERIKKVLMEIGKMEVVVRSLYIKEIIKATKINKREINEQIKQMEQDGGNGAMAKKTEEGEERIYGIILPYQDFAAERGYYVVTKRMKRGREEMKKGTLNTVKEVLRLISSGRKELFVSGADDLDAWKLGFDGEPGIVKEERWCDDGIERFMRGEKVEPLEVLKEIEGAYAKYVEYPEEWMSFFLGLWTMGTYVYQLFDSFPYVLLNGEKHSGKTKTLDVGTYLCFNAVHTADISSSPLFRLVEGSGCTLLIDEAERLKDPKRSEDIREILNSGYKRGAVVYRTNPDTLKPESFRVYSPKMIANIKGLGDVLESRCVTITMLRAKDQKRANRTVNSRSEDWAYKRHLLYSFGLQYFKEIREIYEHDEELRKIPMVSGREGELWIPILTLAKLIDRHGGNRLYEHMVEIAREKSRESKQEGLSSWANGVVLAAEVLANEGKTEVTAREVRGKMGYFLDNGEVPESNWVARKLMQLGIKKGERRGGKNYYIVDTDFIKELKERYGVA